MDITEVLRVLSSVAWVIAFVVIVLAVARAARGRSFKAATALVLTAVITAIVLTTIGAGLHQIFPEERGVVITIFEPGYRKNILQPGLRWVIPFAETVEKYSIAKQTYTMSIAEKEGQIEGDDSVKALTSDGQEVLIDASVIFKINPSKVIEVHIDWKKRYDIDLVRPQVRGIIRDEASQYNIDEIVSVQRAELSEGIRSKLAQKLEENGIMLVDFVLRNIQYSPEYAASVEQKQIAEQQAQQAENVVRQREQEAEQARKVAEGEADALRTSAKGRADARITEAKAEAEALDMIAAVLRDNPELLTYIYVEKLSPGIQVMLLPSDNPFLLPLPSFEEGVTILPTPETP